MDGTDQKDYGNLSLEKQTRRVSFIFGKYRVEGLIYLHKGGRITDFLNAPTRLFLPVLDAKFYDLETKKMVEEHGFLAVNRNEIKLLYPVDEDED